MTKAQKVSIYNHWKKGGSLCCEAGLKFLKTVLTTKQAVKFEAWAYESLSCKDVDSHDIHSPTGTSAAYTPIACDDHAC